VFMLRVGAIPSVEHLMEALIGENPSV